MAYKSDGGGGRAAVGGAGSGLGGAGGGRSTAGSDRGGGGNSRNDRGSRTGARSKDQMDAATRKALSDAFGTGQGPTSGMTGATGQSSRSLDSQANERAVRSADADARGVGGLDQALGAALGFATPLEEKDPYADPDYSPDANGNLPDRANWGIDTAEAIGGVAGLGLGAPGIGTITGTLNDLAGKPIPDINLGPDVFGGGSGAPSQPSTNNGEAKGGANDAGTPPGTIVDSGDAKPPKAEVPVPDLWEYPEDTDVNAGAPQEGETEEQRRRRGNTSIVVLGQGGLAI